MNCLAVNIIISIIKIGNIFSTSGTVTQSVELLKQTAELYPDLLCNYSK